MYINGSSKILLRFIYHATHAMLFKQKLYSGTDVPYFLVASSTSQWPHKMMYGTFILTPLIINRLNGDTSS